MTDRQLVNELIKRINDNTNSDIFIGELITVAGKSYIEIKNSWRGGDIMFGFENEKITKIFC